MEVFSKNIFTRGDKSVNFFLVYLQVEQIEKISNSKKIGRFIFFYSSCQIEYLYRKFKIFKEKKSRWNNRHLGLLNPVQSFVLQKKGPWPHKVTLKVKNEENCVFLYYEIPKKYKFQTYNFFFLWHELLCLSSIKNVYIV